MFSTISGINVHMRRLGLALFAIYVLLLFGSAMDQEPIYNLTETLKPWKMAFVRDADIWVCNGQRPSW